MDLYTFTICCAHDSREKVAAGTVGRVRDSVKNFRAKYFQHLIEINKKGLGTNTNIFPSQIQEFPLIDISNKNPTKNC